MEILFIFTMEIKICTKKHGIPAGNIAEVLNLQNLLLTKLKKI